MWWGLGERGPGQDGSNSIGVRCGRAGRCPDRKPRPALPLPAIQEHDSGDTDGSTGLISQQAQVWLFAIASASYDPTLIAGGVAMNLSDLQNTARGLGARLRQTATDPDDRGFPRPLAVVVTLPFLVCLILLLHEPGVQTKLLRDSIMVAVVLWVLGGVLYAAAQYVMEHQAKDYSPQARGLVRFGMALIAATVLIFVPRYVP